MFIAKRIVAFWQRYRTLNLVQQLLLCIIAVVCLRVLYRLYKYVFTRRQGLRQGQNAQLDPRNRQGQPSAQYPGAHALGPARGQAAAAAASAAGVLDASGRASVGAPASSGAAAATAQGATQQHSMQNVARLMDSNPQSIMGITTQGLPAVGAGSTPAEQYLVYKSAAKVALAGKGVIYTISKTGTNSEDVVATVIPSAIPVLRRLIANCDVYVVNVCSSREEEDAVIQALLDAELVSPSVSKSMNPLLNVATSSGSGQKSEDSPLLPLQRLLFCSSALGKQAIFRHIEPRLLVDVDEPVLKALKPYVHQVVQVKSLVGLQRLPSTAPTLLASPSLQPLASATGTSSPNVPIPVCGSLAAFFYPELDQATTPSSTAGLAGPSEFKAMPNLNLSGEPIPFDQPEDKDTPANSAPDSQIPDLPEFANQTLADLDPVPRSRLERASQEVPDATEDSRIR